MMPGVQIYDASGMVAVEIRLETCIPAILLQIGAFASIRAHYQNLPQDQSLIGLIEYLLCYYSSHEIVLVRSAGISPEHPHSRKTPLLELSLMG
jgi:hypothetical protein